MNFGKQSHEKIGFLGKNPKNRNFGFLLPVGCNCSPGGLLAAHTRADKGTQQGAWAANVGAGRVHTGEAHGRMQGALGRVTRARLSTMHTRNPDFPKFITFSIFIGIEFRKKQNCLIFHKESK